MKVAMVQMTVVAGDVEGNRGRGLVMASEAAQKAQVVVLPELWTTGYALKDIAKWAEDETGVTITGLKNISMKYGVTIIGGSIPLRREGKVYNGSVVIDNGQVIADYHKIHLFSMFGEERFFSPGGKRCMFTFNGITAGMTICYDLRFPELFRVMAIEGAQMVFVSAEWPAVRGEHWRLLNQARAVENQIFICAVNCVGQHRDQRFYGHSMLIAPSGRILVEGTEEENIIYGEADFNMVAEARQSMGILADRRPEMYL